MLELRPRVLTDPTQSWFWTDSWQTMERQAQSDIAAGRVARTNDVEEFLDELEAD